jgi:hypothetical protein
LMKDSRQNKKLPFKSASNSLGIVVKVLKGCLFLATLDTMDSGRC